MSQTPDPSDTLRAWLRRTMEMTSWSATEWAEKAGISRATIYRALNPDIRLTMSLRNLMRLAEAAGVAVPTIMGPPSGSLFTLPISYEVGAGAWRAVDDQWDQEHGSVVVEYLEQYEGFTQWAERVVGDSYNRLIPDGSVVHVVDAIQLGYAPRHGDTVIAVRTRAQGALIERSLKQIEINDKGEAQLWPRSYNPIWSEPLSLTDGANGADDIVVEIIAKVLRSYQRFD